MSVLPGCCRDKRAERPKQGHTAGYRRPVRPGRPGRLILAIALLIAPGAIAFLLARTFPAMMLIAVALSVAAGLIAVYAAFFLDAAPAPTIVLCLSVMFLAAFALTRRRAARATSAEVA
jgi:manganese/iron transport system permease protein